MPCRSEVALMLTDLETGSDRSKHIYFIINLFGSGLDPDTKEKLTNKIYENWKDTFVNKLGLDSDPDSPKAFLPEPELEISLVRNSPVEIRVLLS
jgi:hypothetical protein